MRTGRSGGQASARRALAGAVALLALVLSGEARADDAEATVAAAKRLKGRTNAVWVYGGEASSTPPAGKRYVAAELALKRFDPGVELSDVEAVDPATDAAFGNPQFACVADDGAWLDCSTAGETVVVRFVWTVSADAETLGFTIYGRRLAKRAAIADSGPALPRRPRAEDPG